MKVLFVPTYNYLSRPIIEKLINRKREETIFYCLEVYQPRASFGAFDSSSLPIDHIRIFPDNQKVTLNAMRQLYKRILIFLEELDPAVIITFSDVTFFARTIKQTRFESRVIVMQPSLLSNIPATFTKRIILQSGVLLNKIFNVPLFRTKNGWGELLTQANYMIWSKVELEYRNILGYVSFCGSLLLNTAIERQNLDNSVLVVVPDLPYYNAEQIFSLTQLYEEVLQKFPNLLFEFKYHPSNKARLPLLSFHNYKEIETINFEKLLKYEFIISAYSALLVQMRILHPFIIIYDLGSYSNFKIAYCNDTRFFYMPQNSEELCQSIDSIRNNRIYSKNSEYESFYFLIDKKCITLLQPYFNLEQKDNVEETR